MPGELKHLKLKLFEGTRGEVEARVNDWLQRQLTTARLVATGYSYQGPEFDGRSEAHHATHGAMLLLDMGTSSREEES